MTETAAIERDGARIQVRGALSVHTARGLFAEMPSVLSASSDSGGEVVVDLAAVTEADSAGLALLVHWSNQSAAARFANAPAQLRQLAAINGLQSLFDEALAKRAANGR